MVSHRRPPVIAVRTTWRRLGPVLGRARSLRSRSLMLAAGVLTMKDAACKGCASNVYSMRTLAPTYEAVASFSPI